MNWLNIHTDTLRSEEYLGAEPLERATWLSLLGWCATQENGGLIKDAVDWKDRKWQQVCGITKAEVEVESELYAFIKSDLLVRYYPVESEAAVIAKRLAGKKGGRPRKPLETKEEKPCGLAKHNHKAQVSKREVKTKGKEREGKERKGKEKETKEMVVSLPFVSDEFSHAWNEWQTYLKQKRKTPTELTTKKQINQLKKLNEKDAIETINRSIQNGWQGLFPSDGKDNKLTGRANSGSSRGDSSAGEGISVPLL